MTKRIIDGMSVDQILTGLDHYKYQSQEGIVDYLKSICKPEPSWEDDASADNPILCWVSDIPISEPYCRPKNRLIESVDYVTEINEKGYIATAGFCYKYALPISPDAIWKPTKQGDTK